MGRVLAIASREASSMFRLPVGWLVIALYLFLSGALFAMVSLVPGAPASLRDFFAVSSWLLMIVAPAVSMRLLAEEARAGSIEPLLTSPADEASIVLGKFLGACAFMLAMLAPTLVLPATLWAFTDPAPDPGPILTGYLSLVLQGALYLALGTAASAATSSQTLAYLATLFPVLALLLAARVPLDVLPAWSAKLIGWFSIPRRTIDLSRGVIDSSHICFFLAASAWCLVLAWALLCRRRWR